MMKETSWREVAANIMRRMSASAPFNCSLPYYLIGPEIDPSTIIHNEQLEVAGTKRSMYLVAEGLW
jgi:hypothetical protein